MKSYVIQITGNPQSVNAADNLVKSANIAIEKFDAVVPGSNMLGMLNDRDLVWDYPLHEPNEDYEPFEVCEKSGLHKSSYLTARPPCVLACFLSHYLLWEKCAKTGEPFLIFEHDAVFTRKFTTYDEIDLFNSNKCIVSLNNPLKCTRKSKIYYDILKSQFLPVTDAPYVDDMKIPQGLPGNSAYYITPRGASELIRLSKQYGAWPNDAIMCNQLMPNLLGCMTNFLTTVQGTKSTTTLL